MSTHLRILFGTALLALAGGALAQTQVQWTEGPGRLGLGYPVPIPVDTPLPFDGFRSYAGLLARHQDLELTSDVVHGETIGHTRLGREIRAYRLGAPGELTPEGLPRAAVMYAGTVHPREWQSPEAVTGLMELVAAGHGDRFWLDFLADHVRIVVVPVLNVDGLLQTQRHPRDNWLDSDPQNPETAPRDGRMRRKNHLDTDEDLFTLADHLNGVDLNRNNPPFWPGPPRTADPQDLTYRGPAPQSEPEILALIAAAGMAPASRLRFYADMHSFGRVFFSVLTENGRRNAIQSRLFAMISNHHAALPGAKVYSDSPGSPPGIGTTSEYFGHTFQIPSATWEIEPGMSGAVEYGGFGSNGHDGFILPESQIRRVRDNLALSMAAAAYHMAGPPHVIGARIFDEATGALIWQADWQASPGAVRGLQSRRIRSLEPGRAYRLWIGFSKPMRWRDNDQVVPFPGRPGGELEVNLSLEAGAQPLTIAQTEPQWADRPGRAPIGYHRYRDDALHLRLVIEASPQNLDRIAAAQASGDDIVLGVGAADLTGHRLDADPATVAEWSGGAWTGYESHPPGINDQGGIDRTLAVPVSLDPQPVPFLIDPGHSSHWYDPDRSGEGWSLEILDSETALGYWFTYDETGEQRWLIGIGEIDGNRIRFGELLAASGGRFAPGPDPAEVELSVVGEASLVFSDCDRGWVEYDAFGQRGTVDLIRLFRTMRIDCKLPEDAISRPHADQSGSWYDPDRPGAGFTLYWLTTGQALVTWFTYGPGGNLFWMQGLGVEAGGRIVFPEIISTRGPRFGTEFDRDDLELLDWGELTLELGCLEGTARYSSGISEFGSGEMSLIRLTIPKGLSCPD